MGLERKGFKGWCLEKDFNMLGICTVWEGQITVWDEQIWSMFSILYVGRYWYDSQVCTGNAIVKPSKKRHYPFM